MDQQMLPTLTMKLFLLCGVIETEAMRRFTHECSTSRLCDLKLLQHAHSMMVLKKQHAKSAELPPSTYGPITQTLTSSCYSWRPLQGIGDCTAGPWHQGGLGWEVLEAGWDRYRWCHCKHSSISTERSGWKTIELGVLDVVHGSSFGASHQGCPEDRCFALVHKLWWGSITSMRNHRNGAGSWKTSSAIWMHALPSMMPESSLLVPVALGGLHTSRMPWSE